MEDNDLNLGAHLTLVDGLPAAFELCHRIGGTNLQVFTRNPRGRGQRAISELEIAKGAEARQRFGIRTLIAHLPYTLNPASPDPTIHAVSTRILAEDLRWADRIGADHVVMHPGTHVGSGVDAGVNAVIRALRVALDGYSGTCDFLLEAMAGQGTELGASPSALAAMIAGCDGHPGLGVCLDSCHQFAAGWDLRTPEGVDRMVSDFAAAVGLDRIRAVHLNDSMKPVGSHRDRHARIGQGELGPAGIRAVVTHPVLSKLPLCIETPVDDMIVYADEILAVREILAGDL